MSFRCVASCSLIAIMLFGGWGRAHAEDTDRAAKRAAKKSLTTGDRALKKGLALVKRGDEDAARAQFEEALASYQQAYEAVPNPQIYFAIGRAEELLGRFKDAYSHYRRMLEESEQLGEQLAVAVQGRIEATALELAFVELVVSPSGAAVFVDSRELGVAPLAEALVLEPGVHTVEFRRDGYLPTSDTFRVERGMKITKEFELKPIPKVEDVEEAQRGRDVVPPPPRGLLFGSLALTGGLLIATSVTGALALSRHGVYSDASLGRSERNDARDSGKTLALTTDLLAGATVVSAALTMYYYYGVYRPRRRRSRALETAMGVSMTTDGAALSVVGRF